MLNAIAAETGESLHISNAPRREGDPPVLVANASLSRGGTRVYTATVGSEDNRWNRLGVASAGASEEWGALRLKAERRERLGVMPVSVRLFGAFMPPEQRRTALLASSK